MNKADILSGFNNHLNEFFNDVVIIFPDNLDIKVAQTSLSTMRKANPRLIVSIWKEHIVNKYEKEINEGNIDFFLQKDYNNDLNSADNASTILEKINSLKEPIRNMGQDNLTKTITYIQNLTKLCNLYHA
tara:strand:- start:819 stop:1208 length:390 start_codon:yes stop_codon:yes gene_type:complete